jgi:hypothetical protein
VTGIFDLYKPFRNRIAEFEREDSLRVVWAYSQYLQLDRFKFPNDIEINPQFQKLDFQRRWISEWSLELLAKEIILNCGAVSKSGESLRSWNRLSEVINGITDLEGGIYSRSGSSDNVLVEMIRIAHRIFEWQSNPPNRKTLIRYHKVFDTREINAICERQLGLTVREIYACAMALMGHYIDTHLLKLPITSQMAKLPVEKFHQFFAFSSEDLKPFQRRLKNAQKYDDTFPYAFNPLRARPIVIMASDGSDIAVCPLPTLLYWRITSGLFYDLMNVPSFANHFGDSFQRYVGDVVKSAAPNIELFAEEKYRIGALEKRAVDWIAADAESALFIECKVKRLTWDAKSTLTDLAALESDMGHAADAIVQVYKTIRDYQQGNYPHFKPRKGRKIFPCIVTLENWHMHGSVMYGKVRDIVKQRMNEEGLPNKYSEDMPFSIWPIESLENALQILNDTPIAEVFDTKLRNTAYQDWEWDAFLTEKYKGFKIQPLFEKDFDALFAEFRPPS